MTILFLGHHHNTGAARFKRFRGDLNAQAAAPNHDFWVTKTPTSKRFANAQPLKQHPKNGQSIQFSKTKELFSKTQNNS